MPFSVNTYYRITAKNKEPVTLKVIERPLAIHLIRVLNIKTKEEKYLMEYFDDETAEIVQIDSPESELIK